MEKNILKKFYFGFNQVLSVLIITLLLILLFTVSSLALEEDIWKMIDKDQHEEALELLETKNIESNVDLRFARALLWSWQGQEEKAIDELYSLREISPERRDVEEHLIRVLGWQGRFEEAERMGKQILEQEDKESAESVLVLLAVQAEWQQNWKLAQKRWQKAAEMIEHEERRKEYLGSKKNAAAKLRFDLKSDLEIAIFPKQPSQLFAGLMVRRWLRPGITGSLGINLNEIRSDRVKPAVNFSGSFRYPFISQEFTLGGGLAYRPLDNRKVELNLSGGYQITERQILSLQFRAAGYPWETVIYLTPQYSFELENIVITAGNTLRLDDTLTADFSQKLQFYFSRWYLEPHLSLQRYVDDSYQIRIQLNLEERQKEVLNMESIYFNLGEESLRIGANFINF